MRIITKRKIKKFMKFLEEKNIDMALFFNSEGVYDDNVEYFTGFQQERDSFSCLLVSQETMVLIVPQLEYERAVREAKADEIINLKEHENNLMSILKSRLTGIKTLGIIENLFPYALSRRLSHVKFIDVSDGISEIRAIKEFKEIEMIKKSCRIANHGIKVIEDSISSRLTEKELSLILEQELMKKGGDELAFPTIVTSGKRSAFIHPYPPASNKKISKGIGLVDFGVRCNGYCSDVTLPFTIGKISDKQKSMINAVKDAYSRVLNSIKIGFPVWVLHDIAEKTLKKHGFKFKHSLGHGLGLKVHEFPLISSKPKSREKLKQWKEIKLKENMVFTIEPGVYIPGVGGCRLENDILMTRKKPKILTKSRLIEV